MSSSIRAVALVGLCALAALSVVSGSPFRRPLPYAEISSSKSQVASSVPAFETKWFDQTLDHFNFETQPMTYKQRYLVYDGAWDGKGPIFFYTGNEGDITMFWNNTGFMFDIAPQFNALVVFAEHRYYGQSLPFGENSWDAGNVGFLSVEQVLADYTTLTQAIHKEHGYKVPVVAFGGSYGGMLASYWRLKYPSIVDGAIAASAPVWQFMGVPGLDPEAFSRIATEDFANVTKTCSDAIRSTFLLVESMSKTSAGRAELTNAFNLCAPLQSQSDGDKLSAFINNGFTYMAMTDYPYESSFLQPMPAWPVKAACAKVTDVSGDRQILESVAGALGVYYNYTGESPCFNVLEPVISGTSDKSWDYQSCTEMVLPISSNGIDDFYLPVKFSIDSMNAYCKAKWGLIPRPYWTPLYTGVLNMKYASNIVFSNGQLDPWRGGGVTSDQSESVFSIVIAGMC